ncbi:unnamed protein product [Colias eurytheme]|nr:unnamed protein product [Colias eurytheme]
MADRGKHRVAPIPAPTKKQYAYVPCPRSEEVGTEFALQLLRNHHEEPPTPEKSPPELASSCRAYVVSLILCQRCTRTNEHIITRLPTYPIVSSAMST